MELEITPEPGEAEREAIAAVLADDPGVPDAYRSAWRREADEDELVPFET